MDYEQIVSDLAQQVFDAIAPRVTPEDMERVRQAYLLAKEAHAPQKRKSGEPYILHPISVALIAAKELQLDANTVITAFLHDVVEDTRYTFEDLENEGFSAEVIAALRLLTHDKETPYMEYIANICRSGNETAIRVKLNDLKHNLARGKEGGHLRCVEKHTEAIAYVEAALRGESL